MSTTALSGTKGALAMAIQLGEPDENFGKPLDCAEDVI
jgi:hypothetical protein